MEYVKIVNRENQNDNQQNQNLRFLKNLYNFYKKFRTLIFFSLVDNCYILSL